MNQSDPQTPDQAEAAFYLAFERADFDSMMSVWSTTDDIVCVHPSGPYLTGLDEVRSSWRQLLSGDPHLRFQINSVSAIQSDNLAIHLVQENIHIGQGKEPDFIVVATNIYRRDQGGWRMIVHHASPARQTSPVNVTQKQDDRGEEQTLH